MNQIKIITGYISAWGWQLMAMLFLSLALVLFAMPRTLRTSVVYVAFFLVFVFCEYKTLKRKKEIENE